MDFRALGKNWKKFRTMINQKTEMMSNGGILFTELLERITGCLKAKGKDLKLY